MSDADKVWTCPKLPDPWGVDPLAPLRWVGWT